MTQQKLTKRQQQAFQALTSEWSTAPEILARVQGKKMYIRSIFCLLRILVNLELAERKFPSRWHYGERQRWRLKAGGK